MKISVFKSFFLLKKKQFWNIFLAGIKIKWAGIKKNRLEINILGWNWFFQLQISLKSLFFFFLQKCNFLTFFRLELKKKWAGIKYFGLELIFFYWKSVFLSLFFFYFALKKQLFNIFSAGIKKKVGWNWIFWAGINFFIENQSFYFFFA